MQVNNEIERQAVMNKIRELYRKPLKTTDEMILISDLTHAVMEFDKGSPTVSYTNVKEFLAS